MFVGCSVNVFINDCFFEYICFVGKMKVVRFGCVEGNDGDFEIGLFDL